MELQEIIKKRKLELDLTYEEIGNIVGVSKSTVRKWETGMIENMRRDKILLLAKALQVSPAELLGWDIGTGIVHEEAMTYDIGQNIEKTTLKVDGELLTKDEKTEVVEYARYLVYKRK